MMKIVIIVGSSRKNGATAKVVEQLTHDTSWDVINLLDYNIGHFDYEHNNRNDDFLPLIKTIISTYDVFIFATPVYWYAMSGIMKVFFDRLTDLLLIEKELGRLLRGKYMAVVTSSNGNNLGDQFWLPFKMSADYLGMHYITGIHTYEDTNNDESITQFKQLLSNATLGK